MFLLKKIYFKIIIIGDSFVGKSCLTIKAAKNLFENYYTATVGFEFFTMLFKINSKIIRLQIWDTAGQETFRSITRAYYKNSVCAVLVYDITNQNTFENIDTSVNGSGTAFAADEAGILNDSTVVMSIVNAAIKRGVTRFI